MNAYERRHRRYLVKQTIKYSLVYVFILAMLFTAFDAGQQRVDDWEAETGRYGEGLR